MKGGLQGGCGLFMGRTLNYLLQGWGTSAKDVMAAMQHLKAHDWTEVAEHLQMRG